MLIAKVTLRTRSSWLAVILTVIVCACGGGHDATVSAPLREATPLGVGDPGSCPAISMTVNSSGPTSVTVSPSPQPSVTIPCSIPVTSGNPTGDSLSLYFLGSAPFAHGAACTYTAFNSAEYTFDTCVARCGTVITTVSEAELTMEGTAGSVAVTLNLGGVTKSDGNPCTKDQCTAGGVTHTNLAAGTICTNTTNGVCEGTQTCNGSGSCSVAGDEPAPPSSGNPCLTYTACNPSTGPSYSSNANTSGCSAPSGYVPNALDQTIPTDLVNSASFLWSAGQINLPQAAVIRGRVMEMVSGTATKVAGALVTILGHPESTTPTGGTVTTRSDGWFDIPVNGGGQVTVQIAPPSTASQYFPVQRHVLTKWHQYAVLNDTYVTKYDASTMVPINSGSYFVAKGSTYANTLDTNGSSTANRTAQVIFPPSTTATFTFGPCSDTGTCSTGTCNSSHVCVGTTQTTGNLTFRATEYTRSTTGTLATGGPAAMPADLPAATAYTYAVELSADEAISAGADGISFSNSVGGVSFYVENFLGLGDATFVPAGYYDKIGGRWVPMPDGRVITLTFSGGTAHLSSADTTAGITIPAGELTELYSMYDVTYPSGVSLWRMTTPHFTTIDLNSPSPPPPTTPVPPTPAPPPTPTAPVTPDPTCTSGSIIECENQILGEQEPLVGTPFFLRYQSDRAPGRVPAITIPITGAAVPTGVNLVFVNIRVAGVLYQYQYTGVPSANQSFTWTWNQKDAYGNTVQGLQPADVQIYYGYSSQSPYMSVSSTTEASSGSTYGSWVNTGTTSAVTRLDSFYTSPTYETTVWIGVQDAAALGLGGWTLNVNHIYDPNAHVLWGGDGKRRTVEALSYVIQTQNPQGACGNPNYGDGQSVQGASFGNEPFAMASAPDGSYYVTDFGSVRHVGTNGTITTITHFAGTDSPSGSPCVPTPTSPCPASTSWVNPQALAVGPDGSVYVASFVPSVIQKIDSHGNITTVAGGSTAGCADALVATSGEVNQATGLGVGPDGSVYFADINCGSLRRVGTDGSLVTLSKPGLSGGSCGTSSNDGSPVAAACIGSPTAIAVAPDGTIYIADSSTCDVRRVDPISGVITTYAGGNNAAGGNNCASAGSPSLSYDGAVAMTVKLGTVNGMSVAPDGTLYISDFTEGVVWSVDPAPIATGIPSATPSGIIHIVSGLGTSEYDVNNGPAQQGYLPQAKPLTVGPNRIAYTMDNECRIRSLAPTFPQYVAGTIGQVIYYIPSEDASHVFGFDTNGRHLATYDGRTGAALLSFTYNSNNQLYQVTDANQNTTTFTYSSGLVTISPPFSAGSTTTLTIDGTGHATKISNPNGEATQLLYSNGLLTQLTQPVSTSVHKFTYDGLGNLLTDTDPAGATQNLSRMQTYVPVSTTPTNFSPGYNWSVPIISGAGYVKGHAVTTGTNGTVTQSLNMSGFDGTQLPPVSLGSYSRTLADVRTLTTADGTTTTTTMAPDPRFGMLDPYAGAVVITPPMQPPAPMSVQRLRTVNIGSGTLLSPASIGDATTVNSTSTSSSYYTNPGAPSLPSIQYTSAMGRTLLKQLDNQGRVTVISYPGSSSLPMTKFTYTNEPSGPDGRLVGVTVVPAGSGPSRPWSTVYVPSGLANEISTLTDPVGDVTTFTSYDGAGRVKNVHLPDYASNPSAQYTIGYDPDGNMNALTVPPATAASSEHQFIANSVDLLGTYEPPADSLSPYQTTYSYTLDRQPSLLTIPFSSGTSNTISYNYDLFGRLESTVDSATGDTRQFTYISLPNPTNQIYTATRNNETVTFAYNGFLKTQAFWSGPVAGGVEWGYDNFFRVSNRYLSCASECTTSAQVANTYDLDGLLTNTTSPASFTLTRNYTNLYGRVTGTTLGSISDATAYDGFGDLLTYTATYGTTLYGISNLVRDLNGRIKSLTETINGHASESVFT